MRNFLLSTFFFISCSMYGQTEWYHDIPLNLLIHDDADAQGGHIGITKGLHVGDATDLGASFGFEIDENGSITKIAGETWSLPTHSAGYLYNDGTGVFSYDTPITVEVDGSTTNEIQTISYNTGTHAIDLSISGGSAIIPLSLADGATLGISSYKSDDFNASSGNISIDYTNAQKATASLPGFLSTAAQDIAGVKTFQSNIEFEGATADANETSLAIEDPTADITVTLQDVTGSIPMSVGTPVTLTAQAASISATNFYAVPEDGYYLVCFNATITQAATSTCILGGSTGLQVKYTEATDNIVKTMPSSSINHFNATNRNNTDAGITGTFTVHAKSGTQLQYLIGYSSSGATVMQYNLELSVIKLR